MSEIPHARPEGHDVRSDVSRTAKIESSSQPVFALSSFDAAAFAAMACRAVAGAASEGWWSQTGSNRRPHACKARALPAELWPRTRRRMLLPAKRRMRSIKVVGLGRLELPTSRLSSARSNQLSYKPSTANSLRKGWDMLARTSFTPMHRTSAALARVRPRRKRNEDGEIPPMELNNPETVGP
jgi:hypothetical protein